MKAKAPPVELVEESLVPSGTRELSITDLNKAEALVAQIARVFSDLLSKSSKLSALDLEELKAALPLDNDLHRLLEKPRVDLALKIIEGYWSGEMPLWNDIVCTRFPATSTEAYQRATAVESPSVAWPPALPEIENKELESLVFVHSSFYQLHTVATEAESKERSNERLEFLGDGVLERAACDILFDRFPTDAEGQLSKKKVQMVCNARLTKLALAYNMDRRLQSQLADDSRDAVPKVKQKVFADTFEAYIGAVYLDKGYGVVHKWLSELYEPQVRGFEGAGAVSLVEKQIKRDDTQFAKARLYKLIGSAERRPEYRCLPGGSPFTVEVWIDGNILGRGTAASKKEAGNLAAVDALTRTESIEQQACVRSAMPRTAPVTGRTSP